jgi:hypothetical protein
MREFDKTPIKKSIAIDLAENEAAPIPLNSLASSAPLDYGIHSALFLSSWTLRIKRNAASPRNSSI